MRNVYGERSRTMKDYNVLLTCGETTMVIIHDAFDKGYQQGYEDGQKSLVNAYVVGKGEDTLEDIKEAEYNRGLADSWNVIKKITRDDSVGGYSIEMMQELFGQTCVYDITHNYTPEEAIAKIKAYEDKQKQTEYEEKDMIKERLAEFRATLGCSYGEIYEVLKELRGAENDK
jgi:hypothetical protein